VAQIALFVVVVNNQTIEEGKVQASASDFEHTNSAPVSLNGGCQLICVLNLLSIRYKDGLALIQMQMFRVCEGEYIFEF